MMSDEEDVYTLRYDLIYLAGAYRSRSKINSQEGLMKSKVVYTQGCDVIYLAGAYRGKSKIKWISWLQRQWNIRKHRRYAKMLWSMKYIVLSPVMNSANFDGVASDEAFLFGTQELMMRCDCVAVIPGYEQSEGTRAEIALAKKLGIEIMYV